MTNKLILSTIGTSLLANQVSGDQRKQLFEVSNCQKEQYSSTLLGLLEYVQGTLDTKLASASIADLRRMSAELNGILGIYGGTWPEALNDTHILIATDTYQGKLTAEAIEGYLRKVGFQSVIVYTPNGLTTENKDSFIGGMRRLLRWMDGDLNIEGYKEQGYEVVFNLTGGFKSLQGYLNTIGMFYADRMCYIFESRNSEVIEIPKLPIKIDEEHFRDNAVEFALMYHDMPQAAANIPNLMKEEYDRNQYLLSDWGLLSWNKVKSAILQQTLLDFPKIRYEESFKKDFSKLTPIRKAEVQEAIAQAVTVFSSADDGLSQLKIHNGLKYYNYSGKNSHIGHFRVNDGDRISCIFSNGTLVLRHCGNHDYVNDNP